MDAQYVILELLMITYDKVTKHDAHYVILELLMITYDKVTKHGCSLCYLRAADDHI